MTKPWRLEAQISKPEMQRIRYLNPAYRKIVSKLSFR